MSQPDKLPLLVTAFKMMLDKLGPDDTVSIVTYAGSSGVALEPTKASDKAKIAAALDGLGADGSTAGAAGIEEAYRLARANFIDGGVNRVMLATDGDFNVGPSDDDSLKHLIEKERKGGIFLSVFGFGAGNYNDQLMQILAQNGNGVAAYIDTVSEARKAFVEQSAANLFTIAKDVKIQVEFNPQKIAEYRLVGYETRALNREDFNNDKVDAGDIGSGHSVTAIYEVTPQGSPATLNDPLRYGKPAAETGDPSDELAFVKIRYKAPDSDTSKLIETPVTEANAVASFDQASDDQRFSVAVAAFGQKLRDTHALVDMDFARIAEIAAKARGEDPFGYRAEFLQMVRITESLSKN
jgi:Ca-activated chloride channel family protein